MWLHLGRLWSEYELLCTGRWFRKLPSQAAWGAELGALKLNVSTALGFAPVPVSPSFNVGDLWLS